MPNWIISPEKYLSPDDVKAIRRTCQDAAVLAKSRGNQAPGRDALIIELALGTGLRVSELANLKIDHLHLKRGQNTLLVINGKHGRHRVVAFSGMLKAQILEFFEYRSSHSPYLFPSERGEKMMPSAIQKVFKRYARRAGLPPHYSIHSLRHTYATRLYKASGYNLRLVQQQLGHSSPNTTAVYASVVNADLDEAVERMAQHEMES